MSLPKYFSYKTKNNPSFPSSLSAGWYLKLASLHCLVQNLKQQIRVLSLHCLVQNLKQQIRVLERFGTANITIVSHGKLNWYTAEEMAAIGEYAAQNGLTWAVKYFCRWIQLSNSRYILIIGDQCHFGSCTCVIMYCDYMGFRKL